MLSRNSPFSLQSGKLRAILSNWQKIVWFYISTASWKPSISLSSFPSSLSSSARSKLCVHFLREGRKTSCTASKWDLAFLMSLFVTDKVCPIMHDPVLARVTLWLVLSIVRQWPVHLWLTTPAWDICRKILASTLVGDCWMSAFLEGGFEDYSNTLLVVFTLVYEHTVHGVEPHSYNGPLCAWTCVKLTSQLCSFGCIVQCVFMFLSYHDSSCISI